MATCAPMVSRPRLTASPMPPYPPVTNATLPSTLNTAPSFPNPASVHMDRLAGEVAGFLGGEKRHNRADLARFTRPAQRDLREDSRQQIRALHHPGSHIRIDQSRMHAIDANAQG